MEREGECSLGTVLTEPPSLPHTLCIIVAKNRQKREIEGEGDVLLPLLLLVTSANKMTAAKN